MGGSFYPYFRLFDYLVSLPERRRQDAILRDKVALLERYDAAGICFQNESIKEEIDRIERAHRRKWEKKGRG